MNGQSKFHRIGTQLLREYSIVLAIILMAIVFIILNPRFARLFNILTILQHTSLLAIIASGLTLVLILDEFDLSFAPLCSLAVCMSVNVVQMDVPGFLAVLTALGVGLAVGIVNGLLVALLRLTSFIATLGTATIVTGLSYFVSGGKTIVVVGGLPDWFNFLGQEDFFGVSYLVPIMVIIAIMCSALVRHTQLGRNMYGVGGNREACIVAGINVKRTQIIAFSLCGLLAGFTGFLLASRLGGGHPLAGDKFLLQGFAAVFIGMTMRGGMPNIFGTLMGALLLSILQNGLTLAGVDYTYQYVINGLVIVAFVSAAYITRHRLTKKIRIVGSASFS